MEQFQEIVKLLGAKAELADWMGKKLGGFVNDAIDAWFDESKPGSGDSAGTAIEK